MLFRSEVELVQVARRLSEARRAEEALTSLGIDYMVEADKYDARFLGLFPTQRVGAFFWVPSAQAEAVRRELSERGFTVTVPDREGDGAVEGSAS